MKNMSFVHIDLAEIAFKLGPVMKNNRISHWSSDGCFLGVTETNFLFSIFRDMKSLQVLSISYDDIEDDDHPIQQHDLNDDVMAECIPSLAVCTGMHDLILQGLKMRTKSCAVLRDIVPRMAALLTLGLGENLIDDNCVEVLIRGLAECKHLHSLRLGRNRIGDNGLELLSQGLPASVDTLDLDDNEVALAQQLPLLRFKELYLLGNSFSPGGPGVIAASLANPECRLQVLHLYNTGIGDEVMAVLAESLGNNDRLIRMALGEDNYITQTGWNALLNALCDTATINATHGSNHTLQFLENYGCDYFNVPQDVKMILQLNWCQDKSRVAAAKILQAHRHLDLKPLFDRKLDLLPHVVAWLERFADTRLDLKLMSIFDFVRSMPMEVVIGGANKKKGKKRSRNSL